MALEILSNVFRERTCPHLTLEYFNMSQTNPRYDIFQLVFDIVLRENEATSSESIHEYFNKFKSSEKNLSEKQKKSLDLLMNLFSNKHLLKKMYFSDSKEENNGVCNEKLLDMVKNDHAVQQALAVECILQLLRRSNREDFSRNMELEKRVAMYKFFSQFMETPLVEKEREFWVQIKIFDSACKKKDENQKLLEKLEDSHSIMTSLLLSSAFTYAMLERSPQVVLQRLMLAKTVFRSGVLFGFTMYLERYRATYQEQLEEAHEGIQRSDLSVYVQLWNNAQLRFIYKDMLVFSFAYGFLGFWALLPLLTSFYF